MQLFIAWKIDLLNFLLVLICSVVIPEGNFCCNNLSIYRKQKFLAVSWKRKSGLEIYTRPLVFTSSLSIRTSENCYWLALSDK